MLTVMNPIAASAGLPVRVVVPVGLGVGHLQQPCLSPNTQLLNQSHDESKQYHPDQRDESGLLPHEPPTGPTPWGLPGIRRL
jgi:hypothetical protein